MMMTTVGTINHAPTQILRPISRNSPKLPNTFRVRASSSTDTSEQKTVNSTPKFSPPPNFKPPEPKRFGVRPDKFFDILGAALAFFFRLGTGVFCSGRTACPHPSLIGVFDLLKPSSSVSLTNQSAASNRFRYSASFVSKDEIPSDQYALDLFGFKVKESSKLGPRPVKPIEIYEFESCPFCRKVREIVSVLDIDVLYYPCPRSGPNFRPKVAQMGGKQQFPYMVDPNTGVTMYESDEIIKYLVNKYGDGQVPLMLSLGLLTTLTEAFAMIGRMGRGSSYTPAKLPPEPLTVWAYEGSPFCKVVREVLVELELPYIHRSCARGSPKRQDLYARVGRFQAPYLEDPNTGVQMFESAEIIDYLKATYAL